MLMHIDTLFFNAINKGCSNTVFDCTMPLVTWLGSGIAIFCLAVIILVVIQGDRKVSGIILLAGLTCSYYIVYFLKDFVGRPRPSMLIPYAHLLSEGTLYSFPSGHAVNSFMAALVLSKFFKRPAIFYSVAALIGFSRVYLGVHFVTDVAAGAIIGIIIGYLLARAESSIKRY